MRIFLLSLLVASTAAAVPVVVQHQGRLLDGNNQPVTGSIDFVFSLHTVEPDPVISPPSAVWTRSYTLQVSNGLYAVALGVGGEGTPLDSAVFAANPQLYLQVKVGGQALSPRLIVGSVPYAFFADRASVATDVKCPTPCISGAEIEDGSITAAKIASGNGSGLDADKLDGKDSADFLHNSATVQAGAKFAVESGSTTGALAVGGAFTAEGAVNGAGFAGWDRDATDDLTTATTFGGDVSGTPGALVVADDSHAHTDLTISDRLSIDNGRLFAPAGPGNIGIGTTTPAALLHVNAGAAGVPLRLDGDQAAIGFFTAAGVRKGLIGLRNDISGNTNDKVFNSDAGNWLFTSGRVGIGTIAPSVALDVAGTDAIKIPVGTSNERPTAPAVGMIRFNTTTSRLEFYAGTVWVGVGGFSATGGTVAEIGGYKIHTFTSSGTFAVSGSGVVEVLVVGGGGGGGYQVGGGGGAGGLIYNASYFAAGSISVTVGGGGNGGTGSSPAASGSNSAFGTLLAVGGGAGANHDRAAGGYNGAGQPGGSGGGGAGDSGSNNGPGGAGTSGQGSNGGAGRASNWAGGGGGGAGGAGQGSPSADVGGVGGVGLSYAISGTPTYYAGGGGGCNNSSSATNAGGLGGGGAGTGNGNVNPSQRNGAANTGGGGGGVRDTSGAGGNGGSGIVIVRYPL